MKLFEILLEESIVGKEFTHHLLVKAKTLESAQKKAEKYAKKFWGSWEDQPVRKNEDGWYEFEGGSILVQVVDVRETTKEQFLEECYQRALIN